MQDQPTEKEENDHAGPKDPFVLFRPSFDHTYGVTADPKSRANTIQFLLCPFQHLSLLSKVSQHRSSPLEIFI